MTRKYTYGLVIRKCNEFICFRREADGSLRPESVAPFVPYDTENFFHDWAMLMNKENFVYEASLNLLN
jgi:hypothetical protein